MDYEKAYQAKKKAGTLRRLSPKMVKFEEGQTIVGVFKGRELVVSKNEDLPDFYVYMFDTRDGLIQFPISQAFDKSVGVLLVEGHGYALENKGLHPWKGDQKIKEVEVYPLDDDDEEEEETEGEEA